MLSDRAIDVDVAPAVYAAASTAAPVAHAGAGLARRAVDTRAARARDAKALGYEGDACPECQSFTMVRNGSCLKCMTCGGTSGCS
jgi:ribonucleoside-diphosphate reductase alpha chain